MAPPITRADVSFVPTERGALDACLDWYRDTMLAKCAGLSGEQLAEPSVPPSNLSLLGLVRHMAKVERVWFRSRFAGQLLDRLYSTDERPDADIEDGTAASAESDYAVFVAELDAARAAAAGRGLDETFVNPRNGATVSLRWVYLHMIEEYARHLGHADLLREAIDGVTGE